MPDPQARYEEIADDLASRCDDVELGGAMTFKLVDPAERDAALALPGAEMFDPSGRRPTRQWVAVPAEHAKEWPRLAALALAS